MDEQQYGLVHALVLDGQGGARQPRPCRTGLACSLRRRKASGCTGIVDIPGAQEWLRQCSG